MNRRERRHPTQSTQPAVDPKMCANCQIRPGTVNWVGEMGMLAHTHGFGSMWCEVCTTRAQIVYAKKQAARILELEKMLEKLLDAEL